MEVLNAELNVEFKDILMTNELAYYLTGYWLVEFLCFLNIV